MYEIAMCVCVCVCICACIVNRIQLPYSSSIPTTSERAHRNVSLCLPFSEFFALCAPLIVLLAVDDFHFNGYYLFVMECNCFATLAGSMLFRKTVAIAVELHQYDKCCDWRYPQHVGVHLYLECNSGICLPPNSINVQI